MSNVILGSAGFSSDSFSRNFEDYLSAGKRFEAAVLVISASDFAAENKHIKNAAQFLRNHGIRLEMLDLLKTPLDLSDVQMCIFPGGNPFRLLSQLRSANALTPLTGFLAKPHTLLIGISAGAMVLGKDLGIAKLLTPDRDAGEGSSIEALNIIPKAIFPHYDRYVKGDFKDRANDIAKWVQEFDPILINEDELKIVTI